MNDALHRALCVLDDMERVARRQSPLHTLDGRAKLLVTVVFLVAMLSLPLTALSRLMLFFVYPILCCARGGLSYGTVFRRSLAVLPFVAFVGVFNLFYDREPMFSVGEVVLTRGWVGFLSILVRGLLSVQALLVLIYTTGYYRLCRSMQRLGVPPLFTTQLLFVYRYLYVLIEEALDLSRARDARSFGRRHYPLAVWGTMIGQLLIRTFCRAERIGDAMLARGFTGSIPAVAYPGGRWRGRDTLFLAGWSLTFVGLRFFHPAGLFATWNSFAP